MSKKLKNSNTTTERYVDVKAVSKYTSLPVKTLYEWASIGKMPSVKIGSRVIFDLQDIDRYMESLKRPYNQVEIVADKIIGDININ